MTTIAVTRPTADNLKTPLILAIVLHACLLAFILVGSFFSGRENSWGGPRGSVTVGVVGNLPAIPLPQPDVETPNRTVDESKGLYQSEPKPIPPPDATEIPKFEKNRPPKYVTRPSKVLENPAAPPPNAIPYGAGGAPTIPRSSFAMGAAGTTQAGLSFNGVAGGDFGSRFSWYVTAVQQRISSNWLQSSIDANISWAPRVIVTFDILRDGTIANIQITQSSNNYSVDASARRAVEQSSRLMPLPAAYANSRVSVEFYFDYRRQ